MKCFLLLLLTIAAFGREVFINYALEHDGFWLEQFLHGIKNGFFVDIGANDPFLISNVVGLSDWHGLHVEASQNRSLPFITNRPDHMILNMAITNESGTTAELLNLELDTYSTISAIAYWGLPAISWIPIVSKESVPTLSLSNLCHKYYLKKPLLMSLDIEGVGQAALSSNDWNDQKCIPDLILAEEWEVNVASGFPNISLYLAQKNYIKISRGYGLNNLFVHKDSTYLIKRRQVPKPYEISFDYVVDVFLDLLDETRQKRSHIDMTKLPFYLTVAKENTLSIPDLFRYNDFINIKGKKSPSKQSKPILILQFNPHRQQLYFGTKNVVLQIVKSGIVVFFKYKMQNNDTVFVVNHFIEPLTLPTVLDVDLKLKQKQAIEVPFDPKLGNQVQKVYLQKQRDPFQDFYFRYQNKLNQCDKSNETTLEFGSLCAVILILILKLYQKFILKKSILERHKNQKYQMENSLKSSEQTQQNQIKGLINKV